MLMPDLIDDFARGHRCRRDGRKKAKAAIGVDGGAGFLEAPAVVAREPAGKIQRCVGFEIMLLDPPPQILSGGRPDGLARLDIDFELCPLQSWLPVNVRS